MSLVSSTVSSTGGELMQKVVRNLPCSDQVVRQYQGVKAERRSYFQGLISSSSLNWLVPLPLSLQRALINQPCPKG